MTRLAYRVADVFSDRPLAGNAVCVVLDETPPDLMQRIARETNLSETTFPVRTGPDSYDTRIFTPGSELPFAGHPTLGTAWVLGPGTWEQTSAGATVTVEVDEDGARMLQPAPVVAPTDESTAGRALGLLSTTGAWVAEAGGMRHLIVVTPQRIADLRPDLATVATHASRLDVTTTAVVEQIDGANLHVRVFVPGVGIPEDPGTGSAAGPIAVLHAQLGGDAAVTIHQGAEVGRPCTITVELTDAGPWVGGRVAGAAEGHFTV